MQPLVSLVIRDAQRDFQPGEELECQYQIDGVDAREIQAVEVSVLWYTEGKGDEDMTVHFFRRSVPGNVAEGDLRPLHVFRTQLPNSPLSYCGSIVKIRWCVRLRVFLRRVRDICVEAPFRLGNVPTAAPIETPQSAVRLLRADDAHDRLTRLQQRGSNTQSPQSS